MLAGEKGIDVLLRALLRRACRGAGMGQDRSPRRPPNGGGPSCLGTLPPGFCGISKGQNARGLFAFVRSWGELRRLITKEIRSRPFFPELAQVQEYQRRAHATGLESSRPSPSERGQIMRRAARLRFPRASLICRAIPQADFMRLLIQGSAPVARFASLHMIRRGSTGQG
jgi:hypothetical protein